MPSNATTLSHDSEKQFLNIALSAHRSGDLLGAENQYREILKVNPASADALHYLALALHQQQKSYDEVLLLLGQSLKLDIANSKYLANFGSVLLDRGDLENAINVLRQALDIQPDAVESLYNLGKAYLLFDQPGSAVPPLLRAQSLLPNSVDIQNTLGQVYLRLDDFESAESSLRAAIDIDPKNALAHASLGHLFAKVGNAIGATQHFQISKDIEPTGELYCYIAIEKWRLEQPVEALALCEKALSIKPGLLDAHLLTAELNQLSGNVEKAREHYSLALSHISPPDIALRAATLISPIQKNPIDQAAVKEDIAFNINYLIDHLPIEKSLRKLYASFVSHPYFLEDGEDPRPLAATLFKFYSHIFPQLSHRSPHLTEIKTESKPKVGVYFPRQCVSSASVQAVKKSLTALSQKNAVEVCFLTGQPPQSRTGDSELPLSSDGELVLLDDRLEVAREQISALKLDVICFVEIGAEPLGYFLSFARLAKIQMLLGGTPLADGVDNFDYRVVVDNVETPPATSYHAHELIKINQTFELPAPVVSASKKTRADFELPQSGNLYLCPSELPYLHPSFDEVIRQLFLLDPEGFVILFENEIHSTWSNLLKTRLAANGVSESLQGRLLFISRPRGYADLLALYALTNVVLDPFKVSLGAELALAITARTPVVTLPSNTQLGRTAQSLCQLVDLNDCIVKTVEDYVDTAIQISTDVTFRTDLVTRIEGKLPKLFDNAEASQELTDVFSSVFRALNVADN